MTDENLIISARIPQDPKVRPIELLMKEKVRNILYLIKYDN